MPSGEGGPDEDLTDPARLMEGEDPETGVLEDAEHWLGVYSELLGFKARLIDEAQAGTEELSNSAQEEGQRDLSLLDGEKRRLLLRHQFWQARVRELRRRNP